MDRDFLFVAVGVLLGFLSGLFGVEGSSVATPILRLLDVPRMSALATPLPVTLPTAVVGGITYWRQGKVDLRAALWTALGGVPAVIGGAELTAVAPGRVLMALTGVVVFAVGIRLLLNPRAAEKDEAAPVSSRWAFLAAGAAVGCFSGLLANGGGFLLVPVYMLVFGMEAQAAAATSLVAVAFLALPATYVHWKLGHIDPHLALLLAAGVVPATYAGARVALAIRARDMRQLFGVFLLFFGLAFLVRTLYRAELLGWRG